jgi:transcriptional regulator with XRE-family HTH domain
MKLGQQIMIARKDKQLTQKELCNKVGISLNSLSRFERGLSNPRIETLQNIAKELGVCFRVG